MLYLNVKRSNSDSLPIKPTAAAATAIDCGEIILPVTPPDEFAASASTGSIPTDVAVTCCNFANKTFADVSDPVINTPIHPNTGEKNGNSAPVLASTKPSVVVIPAALTT